MDGGNVDHIESGTFRAMRNLTNLWVIHSLFWLSINLYFISDDP